MARLLGPDPASRHITQVSGSSTYEFSGRTAIVYTDAAGTSAASILTYDGTETPGAAIAASTVTLDADSRIPQFWFPDGVDVLYVRVTGGPLVQVRADYDRRLDASAALASAGFAQAAAVADLGALTAAAPDAITSTDAAGATPTDAEFDALRADVVALRATVAATVTDAAALRTKLNAALASLRTAELLDT